MPWSYQQDSGEVRRPNGAAFCFGFSGCGAGLNNPKLEAAKDLGPIPRGPYLMVEWIDKHPTMGAGVIKLQPLFELPGGRGGFFIHGLNIMNPLRSSKGCPIIGTTATRREMWENSDKYFEAI